jgi:pimeloyl-ACP methyl ester carboxylesterase
MKKPEDRGEAMRTFHILFTWLAIMGALSVAQVRAEHAAAIDYDFVERPANVPSDFQAPAGTSLRFVNMKAIDGFRVEAALWQPEDKPPSATTVIVGVHGSGSNFTAPPIGAISPLLAAKGYAVLSISTRQHDKLQNMENFFDVRRDIEAAVFTARARGYRTLVLWGHSLGNIHVQYYAANTWDADIKAVVLSGMFANLPWRTRYMLIQNEDAFRRLSDAAIESLRDGKVDDLLPLRMRRTGNVEEPVTGQHFLTYRSEASSTADGTYWIKRIPRPILMICDAGDAIVAPFEPYALLSAARSQGSLVPSINYVLLPNSRDQNPAPFSLRDHLFLDNREPLSETITRWLGERHL